MDFKQSEEQELLLENLRELMNRECPESYMRECDEKHLHPTKLCKALVEGGYITLGLPEEYGGLNSDILTQTLVFEEMAKAGGPAYVIISVFVAINDMLEFGNEEQKQITMDAAHNGLPAFSLAITEPQAGSDNSSITTTATRRNGKVYINGHKTFISGTAGLDEYPNMLVVTRDLDNPNPYKAMSMWWVPGDAPGLKMERIHKLGGNMRYTFDVYFDNVEIEEDNLIGIENEGFKQLMKNFELERLVQAATSLGYAEAAFEDAARYANQRVQFGKSIGSFQLIQEKITYMAIKLENMRNMVYKTAWEMDNGLSVQISSALTKLYCVQSAFEVIDDAMQIFGGLGYTNDLRIQRFWRDVRVNRIGGGTEQIMIHSSSRAILKNYK